MRRCSRLCCVNTSELMSSCLICSYRVQRCRRLCCVSTSELISNRVMYSDATGCAAPESVIPDAYNYNTIIKMNQHLTIQLYYHV